METFTFLNIHVSKFGFYKDNFTMLVIWKNMQLFSTNKQNLFKEIILWCNKKHTELEISSTCLVTQSRPTLCDSMDSTSPGSSVHGILQAKILGILD